MDGFVVDLSALTDAEHLVHELRRSFAASVSLKYSIAAVEVGDEELAGALAEFQTQSRRTADALSADTTETADRLRLTALEYQRHDQAGSDLMTSYRLELS
jgi:ABC-type tungstate transport system substrate-binding protein